MRYLQVDTVKGKSLEKVYSINELSYLGKMLECKDSKKRGVSYLEIPCAFDIETTNIYERDETGHIKSEPRAFSFMYHWQFCLEDEVCFGRTWDEFLHLLDMLHKNMNLSLQNRLVIWCHNLPFEFEHFRMFVKVVDGFFTDEHKPIKVVLDNGIEFRDSYILSNMSLQKFCENEKGVIHYKLSGDDYDYSKIRTSVDYLSEYEEGYCYNDVRGLCECIKSRMQEYTLASMPMTSTGYVRVECRNNMRKNKKNREKFKDSALTPELYTMCREAFRGGDTHANIKYVNQVLYDVDSYDITSSYPASMMMDKYPTGAFFPITVRTFENRDLSEYALLFKVRLKNIKYVGSCGIPYIAYSKCSHITPDRVIDNGRILFASMVEMTITDIDWEIIKKDYIFDDVWYKDIYASKYDYLAPEFRETVMTYYRAKTELKGLEDKEYEYMKSKNKLNALYGMMVMRIDQNEVTYNNKTKEYETKVADLEESLRKYYKSRNSFLSYQQGVWVTCNSRRRLRDMLQVVGNDVVYCDTDSIKFINNHTADFEKKNAEIIKTAEACGAYADDKNGIRRYLGVWDHDGFYDEFKTLGAKKYVVKSHGEYYSTIAGVNKKAGKRFFNENGIDAFKIGAKIENSGHLVAYYNDDPIHEIIIKGCKMKTASNLALVDDSYTIGVTSEYLDLLEKLLDNDKDYYYI